MSKQDILDFCKTGQKINAIKELRVLSGAGLREAKDAVEYYDAHKYSSPSIAESQIDMLLKNAGINTVDPVGWKPDALTILSIIRAVYSANWPEEFKKEVDNAIAAHKKG